MWIPFLRDRSVAIRPIRHCSGPCRGATEEYRRLRILNYEMEVGTPFKMGLAYGFAAGCVCAVLAERTKGETVTVEKKDQVEECALRAALSALDGK